jgi:putative transposase
MQRNARIDALGALHHIIVRGIARKKVFDDNADRDFFLERLGMIVQESQTQCFAWAMIPNHFLLLLKTGNIPIATVMKRLLTGYAICCQPCCCTRHEIGPKVRIRHWKINI